jgi:2,3-bisphosphoglycerate-independent phosphoglycerate mutase
VKTVIILGDGMADYPVPELDGKTPLMAADTPAMDEIARRGVNGLFRTVEPDIAPGSEAANLAVLGYDPRKCLEGRGVLEAASLGVKLGDKDVAMRVNLVTIEDRKLANHSAGHIGDEDAGVLIRDMSLYFASWPLTLTQGLSYRHLLVLPGADPALICYPPHDHIGEPIKKLRVAPKRKSAAGTADLLNRMVMESMNFLNDHPVNQRRGAKGEKPASALWPWSPGRKPQMKTMRERFGVRGAVISAVDLIKGIAIYAGMDVIPVEGATGLYDTHYEGKADAAIRALEDHDFVYVHVEAADEAGHDRNAALKIRCIEDLDHRLIRRVLDHVNGMREPVTLAVLPDHPTPVSTGKHVKDPIPVAIMAPDIQPDKVMQYDETSARSGALGLLSGDQFIEYVLKRKPPVSQGED